MQTLVQDIRYALRQLRKNLGFTTVAVLTLALGIGATTAIFSLVDAVLLRSLPYHDPNRLVSVYEDHSSLGFPRNAASPATYSDIKSQTSIFEDVAGTDTHSDSLVTGNEKPRAVIGGEVTHNLFSVLGVRPLLGRVFFAQEDIPGNHHVLLLSYRLWKTEFAAKPEIVGQSVRLNGEPYTVIGVMPSGFSYPEEDIELWTPRPFSAADLSRRTEHFLRLVGRLRQGISLEKANADLLVLSNQAMQQYRNETQGLTRFYAEPLQDSYTHDTKQALLLVMAAVAFILLIACANMANLLLSRAAGRQREITLRAALGAGRGRIVRQLLTESILLALVGGVLGSLLALASFAFLKSLIPVDLSQTVSLRLNWPVLLFSLAISLVSSVIFGMAPAIQASKFNPNEVLKEGGRGSAGSRRKGLSAALVVSEVALSLMLLVGAGLMLRSLANLRHVDPGFRAEYVLTAGTYLAEPRYEDFERRSRFIEQVLERVKAVPGVQNAGFISVLPMGWRGGTTTFMPQGVEARSGPPYTAIERVITPGYFEAMKVPLLHGRSFDDRDSRNAPPVAIINQTMARKFWPNQDAIGQRFNVGPSDRTASWIQVVGVVGDVKEWGITELAREEVYFPYWQAEGNWMWPRSLVVRTTTDPLSMANEVQEAVKAVDPEEPLNHVRTMVDVVDRETSRGQIETLLLTGFAALALVMACVGIYGVMAYMVTQRTSEMGLRMALGAQRRDILSLVLGHGTKLALAGVAIGLAAAFMLTRLMSSLLFRVSPVDPLTFGAVSALLAVAGLPACYLPARQAMKVDPLVALRYE